MARETPADGVRLAELLGVLSLGADLGMGQPMEHVLRQGLIALELAKRAGLTTADQQVVFYSSMLAWVGCHVDAYEQAKWFGDDLALKADFRSVDFAGPVAQATFMLRHLGLGETPLRRAGIAVEFLSGPGRRAAGDMIRNHWRAADALAAHLGLPQPVRACVEQTFERWDGKGVPRGTRGRDILTTARLVNLADVVEVYFRIGGVRAAVAVARERRSTQFAPDAVDLFCRQAPDLFESLSANPTWSTVMGSEPDPAVRLTDAHVAGALEAIADFVDVKSPSTIGHSRAVADLAHAAALHLGFTETEAHEVRMAGLVHDLGRLGVPSTIWEKARELTPVETERVQLHPYLSERMLAFSETLAPLGVIAAQHHERLDGSGYPHGLAGESLSPAGRVLAAADAYRTWCEARPHRRAATAGEAAERLRAEVRAGRFDGGVVHGVLRAAGHPGRVRVTWPAGLTTREVQVLRLLTRGLSNKQIAHELTISRKTVSNHVEHIYLKIGVTNRSLAGLFAARHGLMSGITPDTR